MAIEKIQAQIIAEVDDQSFKQAGQKAKLFARDTKKELDKSFLFKLQLDKANTKIELETARKVLRQAKKDGDKALVLKMTIKTDELSSKLTEAGRKLNNFKNTGSVASSRLGSHFDRLIAKLGGVNTMAGKTAITMQKGFGNVKGLVGELITKMGVLAVGFGLFKLGSQAIFLGDKLEQASISFETMLGSGAKAKVLLEDLIIFAQNTPFELIGLKDSAKQLLAFGIESEQLIPTMKALGDISSGLAVPIDRIALAYGQVKVAGRLMGQDLLQFTSAGVPLIAELAKNMGVAESEVKSMVSAGKVGFADVNNAFKTMTEEGGKFADLMTKQSDTLSGRWSNLKDKADSILEGIGTSLIPFAKMVVGALSWVLTSLTNLWTGLNAIIHVAVGGMVQITLRVQKIWTIFFGNMEILFNGFIGSLQDFGINMGVFGRNFAKVFKSIPHQIAKYLDLGIIKIENFLNKATNGVNDFAKKLGFEGDFVGGISLGRIASEGGEVEALESFKKTNREIATLKNIEVQKEIKQDVAKNMEFTKNHIKAMKENILELANKNNVTKKLDTELKEILKKNIEEVSKKSSSSTKKEAEEKKKQIDQDKKYQKYLEGIRKKEEKRTQERAKALEKGKDLIEDYYSTVRDELDKSQDKIDDFDSKIKDSTDKINKLKDSLKDEGDDRGVGLAERKLEVEQKIIDLENENRGIRGIAKGTSSGTLQKIGEGTLGAGISGNKALEFKKLLEELALLEDNALLISESNKIEAEESETARILRISEEKQKAIQEDLQAEQNRLFILFENKDKEKEKYQEIDEYRTALEYNFTDIVRSEAQKRISELEKIRQKAIATANALAKAGITYKTSNNTNNVNVNLKGSGFSSIDAQNIGNSLVKQIDNANKGINN